LSQVNKALEEINGKNTLGESQTNPVEAAVQKLSKLQKQLEVGTSTSHNLERIERMQEESKQLVTDAKDLEKFAKMSAPGKLGEAIEDEQDNAEKKAMLGEGNLPAAYSHFINSVGGNVKPHPPTPQAKKTTSAATQQGGVMGMLNSARTSAEPAQAAPAEAAAPAQGGVMGLLNSARTSAETAQSAAPEGMSRADRMLTNEMDTLEKLRKQEGRAMAAEKTSESQLNSMIEDMA